MGVVCKRMLAQATDGQEEKQYNDQESLTSVYNKLFSFRHEEVVI